jgi:energy-coupling factor transporter ATP-binding protein EcfA2
VLFLGPSGAGKSTLTASLASPATPLLSDDGIVVTQSGDGYLIEPIYPGLRLLPDSRARLVQPNVLTSDVSHFALKKRIHLADGLSSSPAPLAAIFLLVPPRAANGVELERLSPAQACMKLIEHSFALDPTDTTRGATRLRQAAEVAAQIPSFSLSYRRDYADLPLVHEVLRCTIGKRASALSSS